MIRGADNWLNERCGNCGLSRGAHSAGATLMGFSSNQCPGHEGEMDWENGPGRHFLPTADYTRVPLGIPAHRVRYHYLLFEERRLADSLDDLLETALLFNREVRSIPLAGIELMLTVAGPPDLTDEAAKALFVVLSAGRSWV